jgi:hypothetical protein
MQLSELREYASRRGWTITTEYVDHGVSLPKLLNCVLPLHR